MEFGAVIEIVSAVLTVVGITCLAKYISDVFFLPREIISAIKIFDDRSRENADILLRLSRKRTWRLAGRDTCVLISEKYSNDKELIALINEVGFECYIIDDD